MSSDYQVIARENAANLTRLREALPDAMQSFTQFAEAATTEAVLDGKTKNLIALSLALLTRSENCLAFHLQNLLKGDFSRDELLEVIKLAAYIGGGPVLMFAAQALQAYEQLSANSSFKESLKVS
jgi:AhpD family alkylhydroperoxidase